MRWSVLAVAAALCAPAISQQDGSSSVPLFQGRKVTVTAAELDEEDQPKGPASVCIARPPRQQCYQAPKQYGRSPKVSLVQIRKDLQALLFSAEGPGISGFGIHYALLRSTVTGKDLEDLFGDKITLSNQGVYAFWSEPSLSDAPIFVTANFVWGDEGHYEPHRYVIAAYVFRHLNMSNDDGYVVDDQYMTVKYYDEEAAIEILTAEKPEALARLRRVAAERKSTQGK
jgi:hypothetical protein